MKQAKSFVYNKDISRSFDEHFSVDHTGIYAIEIIASAKSWWQNTLTRRSFLLKDSLAIALDGYDTISFPKKKKLFADDLWNGNVLKGNDLTVYLLIYFEAGQHSISYKAHGKPFIKNANVYDIESQALELHQLTSQKRDRIPWLTFLIGERLSVISLSISARVAKHQSLDDDDISLRLDAMPVPNDDRRAHKDWYWCGKLLKGAAKKFSRQFEVVEGPSRIDILADGTPTIDVLTLTARRKTIHFTEKNIRHYVHKGISGKENYNRFNNAILDAVNKWNQEFDDEYPPPEPLHPNLVKAMIYIESRMGYFESSKYPSYPDVMQVANTDNPAIHTLNRDGWVDPITKKVAAESEWKDGVMRDLDYHGEANSASFQESIVWGTRWLYHLAQGITFDGKRYWRSWKEAVKLYNGGGSSTYVRDVYDVYQYGLVNKKRIIKLWCIGLLLALALFGSGLGVYAYEQNGTFWLSFDETKEEGAEYVLTLNEIRGIMTRKTPIATRYNNGQNFYDIQKRDVVDFIAHDLNGDGYPEIIIEGVSKFAKNVYVLQKVRGEWTIIPNSGEYGGVSSPAPAFHGHDVSFANIDGRGWKEAMESFHLSYSNAQDEIWHTWYRYDPILKAFVFIKKNKEKVVDENDPFKSIGFDSVMAKESPNYQW